VQDPKTRLIAAPAIIDRVLQQVLLRQNAPTFERGFIDQSYACCTGRGPLCAVLAYQGLMRQYRYRLTRDISRYFASMSHEIFLGLIARRLRDRRPLGLVSSFLEAGGRVYRSPLANRVLGLEACPVAPSCGLPLGSALSHWSGGFYLDGLDHLVKRSLKVRGYLRYMDDMVQLDDDPVVLEQWQAAVVDWLAEHRGLELNPRQTSLAPTTQPSTYLGFRVSRAGVLPGPKAKRRLRSKMHAADAIGYGGLVTRIRSYRALFLSL
jgi:hypothetical protein